MRVDKDGIMENQQEKAMEDGVVCLRVFWMCRGIKKKHMEATIFIKGSGFGALCFESMPPPPPSPPHAQKNRPPPIGYHYVSGD